MGDTGLEHSAILAQNAGIGPQPCTKSGALSSCTRRHMAPEQDTDDEVLAAVVAAWPKLPSHVKLAIRALVDTSP